MVEIDAGDTYAYDEEGHKDKREREEKAAARIFGLLPKDQKEKLLGLWEEFEAAETAEAKFAHAMDLNFSLSTSLQKSNCLSSLFFSILVLPDKDTGEGGRIEITGEKNNFSTNIYIKDNGTGIEPEELGHIFERFYKGKNSPENSVGIGLAPGFSISLP